MGEVAMTKFEEMKQKVITGLMNNFVHEGFTVAESGKRALEEVDSLIAEVIEEREWQMRDWVD